MSEDTTVILTDDGFALNEGDDCWVVIQCMMGEHHLGSNPRKAKFLDETAKEQGWMYTIHHIRCDCDDIEILGVWKNKPVGVYK